MTAGTVFVFDADGNPVNTIVSSHNTKAGYALGGGIEARLLGNWTAKIGTGPGPSCQYRRLEQHRRC